MKHKPLYREVLKKSWDLTWKHKQLWIFGLFAGILQTGGVIEMILRTWNRAQVGGWSLEYFVSGAYPGAPIIGTFAVLGTKQSGVNAGGFVLILVLLAVFIGLLWFVSACLGSLVSSIKNGAKTIPKLKDGFSEGKKFGWSIVGFHVIAKLLVAIFFLLTSLPLLLASMNATWWNMLLYVVSFLIFFPLILIVSFITIFAVCATVIHKQKFLAAIETGWRLFRENWLVSIETALILFVITLVTSLLLGFIILLFLLLPAFLISAAAILVGLDVLLKVAFVVALALITALVLFIGSIVTTFQIITWTELYKRLHRSEAVPKIIRLLRAIPKTLMNWI